MSTERSVVRTDTAPGAIGPYSQAISTGDLVFCSGQIPLDPATGQVVEGSIQDQTRRVLDNLAAVLTAAGTSLERVVETSMLLAEMNDFAAGNSEYGEYFMAEPPACSRVQVDRLPCDVRVEIEAIALRGGNA